MAEYKPCPKCSSSGATKVGYTWWGGIVGPSLLTHVKCPQCGVKYNGKTGNLNTVGIIVYFVVVGGIAFALVGLVFWR